MTVANARTIGINIIGIATFAVAIFLGIHKFHSQHETSNLAQQIVPDIPELQSICDSAGGCQNVEVTYTKYGPNNDSAIANQTFWHVEVDPEKYVGDNSEVRYDMGIGYTTTKDSSNKDAILRAIADYWNEYNNSNKYKSASIQPVPMACNTCWAK
jgi:hypothetical protein